MDVANSVQINVVLDSEESLNTECKNAETGFIKIILTFLKSMLS